MKNRNNTLPPSASGNRNQAEENSAGRALAGINLTDDLQRVLSTESGLGNHVGNACALSPQRSPLGGRECESMISIVADIEEFARGWTGRIRRLIHRSSQLIERESLLAGAIARLDKQNAEWCNQTATKEDEIRDHSKRLTEAWLEVESARRKAIQGARVSATAGNQTLSGPVIPAPAPTVVGPHPVQQSDVTDNTSTAEAPVDATVDAAANSAMPVRAAGLSQTPAVRVNVNIPLGGRNAAVQNAALHAGLTSAPRAMSLTNAPIAVCYPLSGTGESGRHDDFASAEAATRQKIEEFKRMQRAIRSNRNK